MLLIIYKKHMVTYLFSIGRLRKKVYKTHVACIADIQAKGFSENNFSLSYITKKGMNSSHTLQKSGRTRVICYRKGMNQTYFGIRGEHFCTL